MATIQNEDWNPVQSKLVSVLSTPDGTINDLGYNTTYSSGQVADLATVTGAQWNALRTDVNKAYLLQTGSNSDLTTRDSTAKITQADLTAISARIDTAYNNRNSISTGQLSFVAGPSGSIGTLWSFNYIPIASAEITFANNAAFRGFWNGGGRLIFSGSRSGGSATSQNQSWTNLLSNMGNIVLTRTSMFQSGQTWPGTFENNVGTNGLGVIGTDYVLAFRVYGQDTNYNNNYVDIAIRRNTADYKTSTSITLQMVYTDVHVGSGSSTGSEVGGGGPTGFGPDSIDGTTAGSVAIYYPYSQSKPNNY